MNFIIQIDRYRKIDELIQNECTGTPKEFAKKIGVGRSHLYRLLDKMKDNGAPIKYQRKHSTFIYTAPYIFNTKLSTTLLSIYKMKKINGGSTNYFVPSLFMRRNDFNLAPIITNYLN